MHLDLVSAPIHTITFQQHSCVSPEQRKLKPINYGKVCGANCQISLLSQRSAVYV